MKTTIIIHIAVLALFSNLGAQKAKIDDREIQVEKKYNTEIYAVEPIFDFASISTIPRRSVTFKHDSLIGISPYAPSMDIQVRPVAYETSVPANTHKAFVKGDKGTTNLWHGQGAYTYTAPNYFNINAAASYDQWQDGDIEDQHMRKIKGALGMTYYLTNTIKSNIGLRYNQNSFGRFGGLAAGDEPTGNTAEYRDFNVDLGLSSFQSGNARWNYSLSSTLQKWEDQIDAIDEINIGVNTAVSYKMGSKFTLELAPSINISNSEVAGDATVIGTEFIGKINSPSAYLQVGASVYNNEEAWSIWPTADIAWDLLDNQSIKITAGQSVTPVGAALVSNLNPYRSGLSLYNEVPYRPDYKALQVIRSAGFDYELQLDETFDIGLNSVFSIYDNDINFQVIEGVQDAFDFSYVDYQVIRTKLQASKTLLDNKLSTGLGVTYQHFMDESSTLWHRSNLLINTDINFQVADKLRLGISGQFNDPQQFEVEAATDSGWRANVNFDARYDVLDQVSVYLNADNLLDNRFQVWNGHATYGRNLSGGLLVKF